MHRHKKCFGQNFLSDQNIIDKIIRSIDPKITEDFVEVGPGGGAITKKLLEKTSRLSAIEIDKELVEYLNSTFATLNVYSADMLKFDFSTIYDSYRLVGNLPYNISTEFLFHCLKYKSHIIDMHFMLQKEVADRICALPNCKEYGRLSIMIQYYCNVKKCFDIKPTSFYPRPKVMSTLVRFCFKAIHPSKDFSDLLSKVVRCAFSQRRKTIKKSLSSLMSLEDFEALNINVNNRAENMSISNYTEIVRYLQKRKILE